MKTSFKYIIVLNNNHFNNLEFFILKNEFILIIIFFSRYNKINIMENREPIDNLIGT